MRENISKAFKFQPLTQYSFSQRILIRFIGWSAYLLLNVIGKTLRFEVEGLDYLVAQDGALATPIVCSWHDRIFAGTYYLRNRGLAVMSSISFDAEYTARCIQRFGFGVIKGSSTRGGSRALVEMIRIMKQGVPTVFTIDGPRGPRYQTKAGPVVLAKRTGCPIIPFSIEASRYWTINSWDRSQIPKPFSRARVYFGEPIFVSADADESDIESARRELQCSLDALVEKGRHWRQEQ